MNNLFYMENIGLLSFFVGFEKNCTFAKNKKSRIYG